MPEGTPEQYGGEEPQDQEAHATQGLQRQDLAILAPYLSAI